MKARFLIRVIGALLLASIGNAADLSPIPFRITEQQFAEGDSIVIEQVIASSPRMEIGDTVIVRGRYHLQSKPKAALGFYLTTKGPSGRTPVSPQQRQEIEEGSGKFELKHVVPADGYLHVSFYPLPGGSSFGGVYFTTAEGNVPRAEEKPATPAKAWFAEIRLLGSAFHGDEKGLTGTFFSVFEVPKDPLITTLAVYRYKEDKMVQEFSITSGYAAAIVREIRAVGLKPFDFDAEVEACRSRLEAEANAKGVEFIGPGVTDGYLYEIAIATSEGRFVLRRWNPGSTIRFYAPHSENIRKLKAVLDILAQSYGWAEFGLKI